MLKRFASNASKKTPSRRYVTAANLAEDLERVLCRPANLSVPHVCVGTVDTVVPSSADCREACLFSQLVLLGLMILMTYGFQLAFRREHALRGALEKSADEGGEIPDAKELSVPNLRQRTRRWATGCLDDAQAELDLSILDSGRGWELDRLRYELLRLRNGDPLWSRVHRRPKPLQHLTEIEQMLFGWATVRASCGW